MKLKNWRKLDMKTISIILILFLSSCSYHVIKVIDGDTIEVKSKIQSFRVRLAGIDCPESSQPYGDSAKIKTGEICLNKTVRIEKTGSDKYGRTIAFVTIGKISLNKTLLASGLAWHYSYFDHSPEFTQIEMKAKINHLGLWRQSNPIEPCKYRMLNHK